MGSHEYHLVVDVWIRDRAGRFLVSRRASDRPRGGLWEPTGGSALRGEESLTAALREVREELGVWLDPARGIWLFTARHDSTGARGSWFRDVWLFDQDVDLTAIRCQQTEVSDAEWATQRHVRHLASAGAFARSLKDIDELMGLIAARSAAGQAG